MNYLNLYPERGTIQVQYPTIPKASPAGEGGDPRKKMAGKFPLEDGGKLDLEDLSFDSPVRILRAAEQADRSATATLGR